MQSYEIFQKASPELRQEIMSELFQAERDGYKAAVEALAPMFKVRPVFVMRMPLERRHQWIAKGLARKQADAISSNILQFWLAGPHKQMLVDFLESLEIEHEDGMVENLPEAPEKEKLEAAIDALLEKYPANRVTVYLQAFQSMDIAGWPALHELLDSRPELKLE